MKRPIRILLGILVFAVLSVMGWRERGFWRPGPLIESVAFGDYEVRIYRRDEQNLIERICEKLPEPFSELQYRIPGYREWDGFEILRVGKRIHAEYGRNFQIAEFGSNSVAGLDITGSGIPKLALTDQLGRQGGGCLTLFECGEHFQKIATVESLGVYPELRDLDGDGIPELISSDNAFYHWPVCIDGQPIPTVILRWRNGKYVPAGDLMVKPAPTQKDLDTLAAEIRGSPEWNTESCWVPEALLTNAVALMYSGHEALGWQFVEAAWKPGFPGNGEQNKKDVIDYRLRARLEDSVYWRELQAAVPTNPEAGVTQSHGR